MKHLDWHGILLTKYDGRIKTVEARFSSRELAMMWFQRSRIAAALGRVPLSAAIFFQGKCIRRHGAIV